MVYIALAIAPGLAISLYIFHKDIYNREPKANLMISFILGMLATIPAYFIEAAFFDDSATSVIDMTLKAYLVVALTEECCKFIPLRYYAYCQKNFDEPFDGIVYSVMVSMGFATVENILYVTKYAAYGQGYEVALLRMFLAVPAHATFGVLMGYYIGKAKFELGKSTRFMLYGLLWAVFFHGTYDTFLFWQHSPEIKPYISNLLLFFGAVISFIVALRLSWKQIVAHRTLSKKIFMPNASISLQKAYEKDIPLIRELSLKIWPHTYAGILSPEQIDYMLNLMCSEPSLAAQMRENHEFIMINNGKEPVGYASISLIEPGIFKLHKIYILPSMQGKGIGKFVIHEIIKAISRVGGKSLQLNVNRNNKAKDFYHKLGFAIIREEDIYIGRGFFMNDYVMEKKIY